MIPTDPIDRLVNLPISEYKEALVILFVNYAKMPTTNITFSGDHMILLEVINDNKESRALIQTMRNNFQKYLNEKFEPYITQLEKNNDKETIAVKEINNLFKNFTIGTTGSNNLFTIQDKEWKIGHTALRIIFALTKFEQQSNNLTSKSLKLLSSPELDIAEPAEQLKVCKPCMNFEQVLITKKWNDSKCSNCGNDAFTVRIYTLNKNYERHKRDNKDLPLFIANHINRKFKNSSITSKNLENFGNPSIKGDVDVFIEKLNTGIECKVWIQESKATDEQLKSYTKQVLDDLKKYLAVGIENLVVVTNLDKDDSEEMTKKLSKELGSIPLKVIPNSVDELDRMINDQIEKLNHSDNN